MSNDYIILSTTGAIGGGKRIRVFKDTWTPIRGQDMPELPTVSGKVLTALDMDIPVQTVTAYARYTESDSLYWTLYEIETIRMGATAALRKLKYQDPLGVVIDALWTNQFTSTGLMGPYIDGTDGWRSVSLRLVKWQ
jgi:hypothetical protein